MTNLRAPLRTFAFLAAACFVGAAGATFFATAGSNSLPADKVVASGSKMVEARPNQDIPPILTATLRSSSPSDLILSVSLECSILTSLVTGPSEEGGSDSATASGDIRVWVTVDGVIVPVNSADGATSGDDGDKVTFCNRAYSRTVEDTEQTLLQPDGDGQDTESDYIATKAANAFNWLRLNLGSGIHTIEVHAKLTQVSEGDATAEAKIGSRTLIVEPTKLANDATVN